MIIKAFSDEYFFQLKTIRKHAIVMFNGCFDILHPGHMKLINRVKEMKNYFGNNTIIICAINSDESVKLQMKKHPLVNDEKSRAEMLLALGIDYVIIFEDENPLSLYMSIIPDCVVTTSGYYNAIENHKDLLFCDRHGILIKHITITLGYSTTNIYNKIESQVKAKIKESL
jgi:D-beta-D-heptose 7-phosphate kinase/D-beta-D-heptose 1-phosphate adenosyltransferase